MTKATKPRSEKQLANDKRLSEAAALRREASKNKNPEQKENFIETKPAEQILNILEIPEEDIERSDLILPDMPEPSDTVKETIETEPNLGELQKQIQELKDMQWALMKGAMAGQLAGTEQASADGGKLTGTFEKYALSPDLYPDPSERLAEEPKLQRFAFKMNYELSYEVKEVSYTTIDGIRTKEPRFDLTLVRVMLDEETGEDTDGRYDICRIILHEDPDTALTIARNIGFDMDSMDEQMFLNEMRYIRMRDWLLEAFYPPKPDPQKQKRDMVINGKLVQYWQKNAEEGSGAGGIKKLDWDKLPRVKF